jgi:uncharacterized protein (TIGR02996 family)
VNELEALLRADPDDEATWLVYGDWLLEHGDARGELVRSHRELTDAERKRYSGATAAQTVTRWKYGFPVEIELPIEERTVQYAADVLAHADGRLVSSLRFRPWRWEDDRIFERPVPSDRRVDRLASLFDLDLTRLRALAFAYYQPDPTEHVQRLVAARLAITELDMRYCKLTDAHVEQLCAAPWMRDVRRLHLQGNPLTDACAPQLAALELDHVDVRYTKISPEAMRTLHAKRMLGHRRARTLVAPDAPRATPSSFHDFENIIPLDKLVAHRELALRDHTELAHEVHRFTLAGELPALDELPLYAKPLNAATRGGQRYIFHSAHLADALTKAVRDALPLPGFSHVNPVFRCNRFEPGDEPFHAHLDTPYYDAARQHVSKYTLLIYLTGGTGTPALQIENVSIDSLDAMTCVLFHQAYEHTGRAYDAGRKVFLRTELVFEDATLAADPKIAAAFSKACYFTGESLRVPELARDADALYNRVAAAHWSGAIGETTEPFVHKQFRGVHWLANGYDFWFPRSLPLADCAALTLLDYLNCKLEGTPFRDYCNADTIRERIDPDAFLGDRATSPLPALDDAVVFPEPEGDHSCCPGHATMTWDATLSHDINDLYGGAQRFARARIDPAPVLMLGHEVYLHRAQFIVQGNLVHTLSRERLAPVNFAACWNCRSRPQNYVEVDMTIGALHPLVPPIIWRATRATHHLMFDFFRNDWAVSHHVIDVPVPRIRRGADETIPDDEPWLQAAAHAAPDRSAPSIPNEPWWARRTGGAVVNELLRGR